MQEKPAGEDEWFLGYPGSTDQAGPCLASKIRQDWPRSWWYGCRPQELPDRRCAGPLALLDLKWQQWFQVSHSHTLQFKFQAGSSESRWENERKKIPQTAHLPSRKRKYLPRTPWADFPVSPWPKQFSRCKRGWEKSIWFAILWGRRDGDTQSWPPQTRAMNIKWDKTCKTMFTGTHCEYSTRKQHLVAIVICLEEKAF